jgi:hypothetical protein
MEQKDNGGILLVGAVGLGVAGLLALSKTSTASFSPKTGHSGDTITVAGANWIPSDIISSVTIGGINAEHTLAVDETGVLSGTIIVPSLDLGIKTIVIIGTETGLQSYTNAITIISSWTLMTPIATVLTATYVIGTTTWTLMTPTAKVLTATYIIGTGTWTLMTPTAKVLTVTYTPGALWNLNTLVNPVGSGYITRVPDKTSYSNGETVTLFAQPEPGYQFRAWGGVPGSSTTTIPIIDVVMTSNLTAVAYFDWIGGSGDYVVTVSVDPTGMANFALTPNQSSYRSGMDVVMDIYGVAPYSVDHITVNGTYFNPSLVSPGHWQVTLHMNTNMDVVIYMVPLW